jgi:hypothetical protein
MTVDPAPRCGCDRPLHVSQDRALKAAVRDPDPSARPYPCPDNAGWHISTRTPMLRRQRSDLDVDEWTTPGERFRRLVDKDIRVDGTLPSTELRILHGRPLLWLAVLHQVRNEIQNHISTDRIEVAAQFEGHYNSPEHLRAKIRTDQINQKRRDVITIVERRMGEAKSLLPDDPLQRTAAVDIADQAIRVLRLLESGDTVDAKELMRFLVQHLTRMLGDDTPITAYGR